MMIINEEPLAWYERVEFRKERKRETTVPSNEATTMNKKPVNAHEYKDQFLEAPVISFRAEFLFISSGKDFY